jgi:aerobic-type carbon monoxide dehydrogenase small subunit (CoxS/CutS family)
MADPESVTFTFEGRRVSARHGQSIGAALWAAGERRFRDTRRLGRPRAIYCGIGQCFDCLVRVNGGPACRACVTAAVEGDEVTRD